MPVKRKHKIFTAILCAGIFSAVVLTSFSEDFSFLFPPYCPGDFAMRGIWENGNLDGLAKNKKTDPRSVINRDSRTYVVQSSSLPEKSKIISYGGALNLKYYSGISYEFLRKKLTGKTVSLNVLIPEEFVSPSDIRPNRLRAVIKSNKNGEWTEYCGREEWTKVKKKGIYNLKLEIPEEPIELANGKIFDPEDTVLFCVEYYFMEGRRHHSSMCFYFFDFKIDGISLKEEDLKWQFMENGYVEDKVFLPAYENGSAFICSMKKNIDLAYRESESSNKAKTGFLGTLDASFLTLPIFVPKELRSAQSGIALTVKDLYGINRSCFKDFSFCNLEGWTLLTVPLEDFSLENNNTLETAQNTLIALNITSKTPHTYDMMPIVLKPLTIKKGMLIPFDNTWEVRDIQELGGYKKIEVRDDDKAQAGSVTVTKRRHSDEYDYDVYQLDTSFILKGGIDWKNPYYRVEFIKKLEPGPVDFNNAHIEVLINPRMDATAVWQQPIRARIGLLDINDKIMFGPNVSLSEGLQTLAYLDVSTTNPIPKGFVMPGFDPRRIKAIVINIEASHGPTDVVKMKVSFNNLNITKNKYEVPRPPKTIDFSRFARNPESWQICKLIKDSGGYLIGINYPFPVVDVPKQVLEVPQVYPCVGMKATDLKHLGLSSEITRKAALKDFEKFASCNINVIRFLFLGHLEGVFTWDERGKDIVFGADKREADFEPLTETDIAHFMEFLNKNEDTFFNYDAEKGALDGLEAHVIADFTALYDILEEIEQKTGKRLLVILSLVDFMTGDGVTQEGPFRKYRVGEHMEVIVDPLTKAKAQALLWKLMKIMSQDERFFKYTACVEIMNEPANASFLATQKYFTDLVNFVGDGLYLLKDALGPSIPVTVGFRSWPEDLRFWASVGEGIDILIPHYWESLESYNIDKPELWSLDTPADRLWDYLGTEKKGRITGMGEISPGGFLNTNLFRLENAGYDFALIWSYSGHDGHNAKPVINSISRYQMANAMTRALPELTFNAITRILSLKGVPLNAGNIKHILSSFYKGKRNYRKERAVEEAYRHIRKNISLQ